MWRLNETIDEYVKYEMTNITTFVNFLLFTLARSFFSCNNCVCSSSLLSNRDLYYDNNKSHTHSHQCALFVCVHKTLNAFLPVWNSLMRAIHRDSIQSSRYTEVIRNFDNSCDNNVEVSPWALSLFIHSDLKPQSNGCVQCAGPLNCSNNSRIFQTIR